MNDWQLRQQALQDLLRSRILVLDGAMGTMIQQRGLRAEDFGGTKFEGCNEHLVLTRPDIILDIHRSYLAAGADMIETNTFGGTRIVLGEYGLEDQVEQINQAAVRLARQAAEEFSRPGRPRFVAGSMGPTTRAISVTGGVTFQELEQAFYEQARALIEAGVDVLLLETCQDTRNTKAAIIAIERARRDTGVPVPLMISCTIEPMGTMLAGQTVDAFWISVSHARPLSIGLNCGTGPEFMSDHIRTLHQLAWTHVSCYPNAGLPNAEGRYEQTPESFAAQLERFMDHGWLNIVGGCCGTTPEHIRAVAVAAEGKPPRLVPERPRRSFYSGIELVEADESSRPLLVGERTNVVGSRAFRELIQQEKWDEAAEIARRQIRQGAHIVDVCLQSSDRNELADIPPFYELLVRKIKAPIMIDSTDPRAIELALTYCQGKSIINSINLEEGEKRFEAVCPLIHKYGAAVVVGCIDEDPVQAQAFTRERKLAIAERAYHLLTTKYEVPPEDIIIDPLVFPCATGDEHYIGGAVETIEAVRLIKERLPYVKTILGISNVSFGLPPAAREVVNSVFLYHATKAGLDLAIVNTERLHRFASIPEEERRMAEDLLFNRPPEDLPQEHPLRDLLIDAPEDWREQNPQQRVAINQYHIERLASHFRERKRVSSAQAQELSLDERIARYVIEGTKEGLIEDLNLKLQQGATPLEIINGPLMRGMEEVGRLFNNNELIVAEVLQSAEVMKAAVAYLQQFMEKTETSVRGKVILATVKGDVHDIGKNLVDIIFSNNGYQVINLGIKVPPEELIKAYHEHHPDVIGLSGLLVKSAHMMVATASDFREANIRVPLMVGGAALTEKFTREHIAPAYQGPVIYAKDAMEGLRLLNEIMDPERREIVLRAYWPSGPVSPQREARPSTPAVSQRSSRVRIDIPKPKPPDLERHVLTIRNLREIWGYINPQMLYGKHLGFRGNFTRALAERDAKALELYHQVEAIKEEAQAWMEPRAIWQFFEVESEGNTIHFFAPGGQTPIASLTFPRQPKPDGLCLADYVLPPDASGRDHIALFVVTAGHGVIEKAAEAKARGEYFKSHALQALALETAEALAEWLHRRIREDWGFPDPPDLTMKERLQARYRGKRYSFGYPACPDLEGQQVLFDLLHPEDIGVRLTEGLMMDPEASVSAMVFHHPDCTYFSAAEVDTAVPI